MATMVSLRVAVQTTDSQDIILDNCLDAGIARLDIRCPG